MNRAVDVRPTDLPLAARPGAGADDEAGLIDVQRLVFGEPGRDGVKTFVVPVGGHCLVLRRQGLTDKDTTPVERHRLGKTASEISQRPNRRLAFLVRAGLYSRCRGGRRG